LRRTWGVSLGALLLVAEALSGVPRVPASGSPGLPRVRFVASAGASILVHGTYPRVPSPCVRPVQPILHARFVGTVEVGKASDGKLFVIGALPFEEYLKGIAEVPRTWPEEALKAQVVAARSYALAHVGQPDSTGQSIGYQLCATQSCQVYTGLGVVNGPYGERWRAAVDSTAGQVLLYQGRPADTLYSSTSNGRTYGNDQVFGSAPLPYLRPIRERDDGHSPLSHWRATIRLTDVARFLRADGDWSSRRIRTARTSGSKVIITDRGGGSKTIDVAQFRVDMNDWAHCLEPSRYPGVNGVNGTALPQTVPSKWFSMSTESLSAVLAGRGWGHGVGMIQWGAEGKADRGLNYRQILAAYYGGLRPRRYPEPAVIRVGIATGLASVQIQGTGSVVVKGRGVGPGPWSITGGRRLQVTHGPRPPRYISAGSLSTPRRARAGHRIIATLSLPQLSVVQLVVRSGRQDVALTDRLTEQPGTVSMTGQIPRGLFRGRYVIQAVVTNGVDIVRTRARTIVVAGQPAPSPSPIPSSSPAATSPTPPAAASVPRKNGGSSLTLGLLVAGAALMALAVAAVAWRRRSFRSERTGGDG
jgi:SpoIID/LytB domain protein